MAFTKFELLTSPSFEKIRILSILFLTTQRDLRKFPASTAVPVLAFPSSYLKVPTVSTTDFPSAGRNNKPLTKRGDHRSCFQSSGGILQQQFSCGEEGRERETPSNQPFQVQQLCATLPCQDGGLRTSCGSIETRGFHVQTRPEGRLFLCPPSQAVSEIHPLSVPRQDIPIA